MYEEYWNLSEKPFRNVADRKYFFYAENYEESYLRLLYNVSEAQGVFFLFGESGTGKSLLSRIFMQDMQEQGYRVALVSNPSHDPHEFLQQILHEFHLEFRNKSRLEIIRDLKEFAQEQTDEKGCILLVDEAHLISNTAVFEEIRLLLNLETSNRYLISPVLIGKPDLLDTISKTSLKERMGLRSCLRPLTCRETGEYIYYRLEKSGCSQEIFSAEAIQEIFSATGGLPRDINNICNLALLLGYGEGAVFIDKKIVQKAVADLRGEVKVAKVS